MSCIAFTLINLDGMMILVWTDGIKRKYRTLDQIQTDHARRAKNIYITPGQYFLYIPKGVFVALPADTVHAGGFCFGSKMKCPTKTSKMRGKENFFQNQCLHFTFCCSDMAAKESKGETHITIVGDNKKPLEKDFVPDEKVMDQLYEVLLDRHPNFMPSVNEEESDEVKTKKTEKIPRPMFLP